jgi:hypothetical protein
VNAKYSNDPGFVVYTMTGKRRAAQAETWSVWSSSLASMAHLVGAISASLKLAVHYVPAR